MYVFHMIMHIIYLYMYKLSHVLNNNGHKVNEETELGNVPKLKCRRSNRKRKEELERGMLAISSKLKCFFSCEF